MLTDSKKQITIMDDSKSRKKVSRLPSRVCDINTLKACGLRSGNIQTEGTEYRSTSEYLFLVSPFISELVQAGKRITQLEADLEDSRERYDALDLRTKDWQCPAGEVGGDHQSCGTKITNLEEVSAPSASRIQSLCIHRRTSFSNLWYVKFQ
jgi:hypothetical protein